MSSPKGTAARPNTSDIQSRSAQRSQFGMGNARVLLGREQGINISAIENGYLVNEGFKSYFCKNDEEVCFRIGKIIREWEKVIEQSKLPPSGKSL